MEVTTQKKRLTVYVDTGLIRWLWDRRLDSGRSVSEIAEDLMVRQIGYDDPGRPAPKRPADK